MYLSQSISDIQSVIAKHKRLGQSVGFVPTMGALHNGHLSLIKHAKETCDIVIASIYINPTQFNNQEDLSAYPKTLEADIAKLESLHTDLLFTPTDATMYPEESYLSIHFGTLEKQMEGAFRPNHFNGVGQIVTKLFNIVQPDKAFFGQKDFQQLTLIRRLTKEFCFPIEIISVPIERETNGLAMSSRNERLSSTERAAAKVFYETLLQLKEKIHQNPTLQIAKLKLMAEANFAGSLASLEYFEVVSDKDLSSKKENYLEKDTVLCIAGYIGNVRLIDNMYLIS